MATSSRWMARVIGTCGVQPRALRMRGSHTSLDARCPVVYFILRHGVVPDKGVYRGFLPFLITSNNGDFGAWYTGWGQTTCGLSAILPAARYSTWLPVGCPFVQGAL